MNDTQSPVSDPMQQRQRRLILVVSAIVVCAGAAYFSGGGSEDQDKKESSPQGTQVSSGKEQGDQARPPGVDEHYDDTLNDGEAVDLADLGEKTPMEPSTALAPQPPSVDTGIAASKPAVVPATAETAKAPGPALANGVPPKAAQPDSTAPTSLVQKGEGAPSSAPVQAPSSRPPAVEKRQEPSIGSVKPPIVLKPSPQVLTQPARPLPAVIAHTKSVITEADVSSRTPPPLPQAASPAPGSKPLPPAPKPRAVKATKAQAETFAQESTQTWQNEGRIPSTQRFRLPKSAEAASPKVWRADDTPTSPSDKKPFGLVLVDTAADDRPPPAITHSPGGIPVRNLPEGESALKKQGLDKPLWKRPE